MAMGAECVGALDCSALLEMELNARGKVDEQSIATPCRTLAEASLRHLRIIAGLAAASPRLWPNINDMETLMSVFAASAISCALSGQSRVPG